MDERAGKRVRLLPARAWSRWRLCAFVWGTAALAVACGGSPKTPQQCDQVIELEIQALDRINPGDDAEPLPVVVRAYQLKDRGTFETADFNTLWQEDAQLLGPDLLDRSEWTMFPGTRQVRRLVRKSDTNMVAVIAFFRHPLASDWQRIMAVPDVATGQKLCDQGNEKGPRKLRVAAYQLQIDGSSLRQIRSQATSRGR